MTSVPTCEDILGLKGVGVARFRVYGFDINSSHFESISRPNKQATETTLKPYVMTQAPHSPVLCSL